MKYILLTALLLSTPLMAKPYEVNQAKSQVTFTLSHAGNEFTGPNIIQFHINGRCPRSYACVISR